MLRLIEAEELKHILNNSKYYGTKAGNAFADMITECKTIEERKTGEWIHYKGLIEIRICSCCYSWFDWYLSRTSFCPNCGADMRGDGNDN